jgi:hypothetical protein
MGAATATNARMSTPRAFISYSHDSVEHKQWVLMLATRLRASGVDAILDLWELEPGADLPAFMEKNLVAADRVLMICTDNYVAKANSGTGGVGYEKMIVTADLLKTIDSKKVIPIIRQGGTRNTPTFLSSKVYLDFSRDDQFEFGFDELTRTLHGTPLLVKPPIESRPFPELADQPKQAGDPMLTAMGIIVQVFEDHTNSEYLPYSKVVNLAKAQGVSRLYFDFLLAQAVENGLLRIANTTTGRTIVLSDKGTRYALQNNLKG